MDMSSVASNKHSPDDRPLTPYDFNNMLKPTSMQPAPQTPPPPLPDQSDASMSAGDSTPHTTVHDTGTADATSPSRRASNLRVSMSFRKRAPKRDSGVAQPNDDKRYPSTASDAGTVPSRSSLLASNPPQDEDHPHQISKSPSSPKSRPRKLVKRRYRDSGSDGFPSPNHSPKPISRQDSTSETKNGPKRTDSTSSSPRIDTDISRGDFERLRLSDAVKFSPRGSVFLDHSSMTDTTSTSDEPQQETTIPVTPGSFAPIPEHGAMDDSAPKSGDLVAGERIPISRTQSRISMQRVLSAEESVFSMRVRSLYEQGDDSATIKPIPEAVHETAAKVDLAHEQTAQAPDLEVSADTSDVRSEKQRVTVESRRSSVIVAKTGEPFDHPSNTEIDRYGFIVPRKVSSEGPREPGSLVRPAPMQRVSTTLQLVAQSPRPKRGVHRAISGNQRPSSSQGAPSLGGPESSHMSLRSTQSRSASRSGVFQRRRSRLIEDASDMLTLPPGLADIQAQQDVDGRDYNFFTQREIRREEKWRKMARLSGRGTHGEGMSFDFDTNDLLVIKRAWKGIPDSWRATAWYSFLVASAKRRGLYVSDDELVAKFNSYQTENCADDMQIDVDVPRTITSHVMFRTRYKGGQRLLFRILHAISLHFPDTGYVQGMASLAATLLCYYDEERAFVMLVRIWGLRGLETLFRAGFDGLMAALAQFETVWLDSKGDVTNKLKELGITGTAYGTRWYLTLFNMSIPFAAQLRVWDVFMLLGDAPVSTAKKAAPKKKKKKKKKTTTDSATTTNVVEDFGGADLDVLHAVSAALMDATRDIIVDSDFENTMKTLTSWIPIKDEDLLMSVAKEEYRAQKAKTRRLRAR